jgi:putative nucleotidyltransferase with HDIG domain
MASATTATTADGFVKQARELPVMPPVATEVIKKAEDPDTDLGSLAQLISRDASLAVRVLKIANSSFYSMPREVESIQQAIVLLGYSTLRSVVVAASMKDVFARFGLAERLLWEHATAAGLAAGVLAENVAGISRDEAFVGGLVHDVGKLVMYSQAEQQYQQVLSAVYSGEKTSIAAEREVFGFDHAEVGALVLGKWKLPERLSSAVGAHHDLSLARAEGSKPLAALLQVADRMCLREGYGRRQPDPASDPLDCDGAKVLGVGIGDLEEMTAELKGRYGKERGVFG